MSRWFSKNKVTLALVIGIALVAPGCALLGPNEEYRQEGQKTVYRSADHTAADAEVTPPVPRTRVPGE